jgi:DNA-directed RNA polymerase subunit K/omega
MPSTQNPKTLYSKTNPVDITSLLTNSNLNLNLVPPIINQLGGKRSTYIKKKQIDDDDEDNNDDKDSDSGDDSESQYGSGDDVNEDEKEDEQEEVEELDEQEELEELEEPDIQKEPEEKEDEEADDEKDDEKDEDDDDAATVDTSKKCYSKYAKVGEDLDLDEYFKDNDITITKTGRVGKPILFKYEMVRLLADRSRQLAEGAKPMVKNTSGLSHKEIAVIELKNKLIPLIIERPIPNSGSERWRLSELEIPNYD